MLPNLDGTCPALVLKMSDTVIHHGALAVARTLGRVGVPVYVVDKDAYTPLAMSRYVTKAFVWNDCPVDPESFVKALLTIAEAIARPTIIISMDDLSAVLVAENATQLEQSFILPKVRPNVPRQLANKACLHALCAQIGIPSARIVVPRSFDDVRAFVERGRFPVVVKAAEQWLPVKDLFVTKVIQTPEQLFKLCEDHDYEGNQRLIIQEYIRGEDWISHGYYNSQNNVSVTFTGKKLRAYPNEAGSTAVGISLDNKALRCASERLLKAVSYSGIFDMDWRWDDRDGQYKLLDCNPRVGQNFRMFETATGIDVVRAQHLDLSGKGISDAALIEGRLFTVESFYALAFLRRLPKGAPENLKIQEREWAWWSSDDPVPCLAMGMRLSTRILGRALGLSPMRSQ